MKSKILKTDKFGNEWNEFRKKTDHADYPASGAFAYSIAGALGISGVNRITGAQGLRFPIQADRPWLILVCFAASFAGFHVYFCFQ